MALLTFRSQAAAAVLMQSENANRLLDIIGKAHAERGVITADQTDAALSALLAAVAQEPKAIGAEEDSRQPPPVGLRQRAFPLIEMLRAASKSHVDVTWGI